LENISDEKLNLDDIADILNISRSGIYAKIKALTGLSTSNYINKIKMQKAKAIIETENKNISEIAYMVGITNLPYFSTLFRREYGISPNDYKRQIHP
jgi:AraC-like DNA-binding protein